MNEYAGLEVRSGSLFKAGIKYLGDLRRYSREQFKAENSHELMRCLEVLDLIDIGEVVMVMSDNRKESRPPFHNRSKSRCSVVRFFGVTTFIVTYWSPLPYPLIFFTPLKKNKKSGCGV